MKILIVEEKYNNKKLIDYLQKKFDGLSSTTIYKALRKKDIRINDKRISENCLLRTGDEIKVYITDNLLSKTVDIPIVYEDENIVVFNKPSNMETTGDSSLTSYAKNLYSNHKNIFIEPCHRLDRNTCGLVLFARNKQTEELLLKCFKNKNVEKHYMCVVVGKPQTESQKLQAFLFKDSKKSIVYISDVPKQGYQKIVTSYKVLKHNKMNNLSLLDITIETGRTHQIRAHLAHIGLPILGDGKYGINKINSQFKIKSQCLASYSLELHNINDTHLSYLNNVLIKLPQTPFDKLV